MIEAEIIANAFRGKPEIELHDAIRRDMEKNAPKPVKIDQRRERSGRAPMAAIEGRNKALGEIRDKLRPDVWRLLDSGMGIKATAREIGKSQSFVNAIIAEGRP